MSIMNNYEDTRNLYKHTLFNPFAYTASQNLRVQIRNYDTTFTKFPVQIIVEIQ